MRFLIVNNPDTEEGGQIAYVVKDTNGPVLTPITFSGKNELEDLGDNQIGLVYGLLYLVSPNGTRTPCDLEAFIDTFANIHLTEVSEVQIYLVILREEKRVMVEGLTIESIPALMINCCDDSWWPNLPIYPEEVLRSLAEKRERQTLASGS